MIVSATHALPRLGIWTIDPVHSSIRFKVRHHAVATFVAGFTEVHGSYDADAGKLTGEVATANVDVPMEMLREHLQKPEFFDAANHSVVRFESTAVLEEAGRLEVRGILTLRGTTREVRAVGTVRGPIDVKHPDGSDAIHFGMDLSATIDRRDYGVKFNSVLPGGADNLGWEVTIEAALELIAS